MYGEYGPVFTSTGFTNTNGYTNGSGTTRYLDTSDLNSVDPTGMTFTLNNESIINCQINGNDNRTDRTIMNSNGSIDISGVSRFFVNYGKQGVNKNISDGTLVKAIFTIKKDTRRDETRREGGFRPAPYHRGFLVIGVEL